jgi:hypothetical protein
MKKISTFICAGVLVSALCAAFVACNNEPNDQQYPEPGKNVSFTEYSLEEGVPGEEISARWVNLNYDEYYKGKTLVINSDEEMGKYVEGDYPAVDFTKKTLVLVYGCSSGSVFKGSLIRDVKFQQVSDHDYVVTVYSWATLTQNISYWQIPIVVDKLPSDSEIQFNGVIIPKS